MYLSAFIKQGDSMALNLITRQEYKAYAGIKSTNYDVEIDALIPRVSELVKNYCRRTFVDYMDTEKIEVFAGDCDKLILSESPVVSVNLVQFSDNYGQTYTNLQRFVDWIEDGDYILPLNTDEYWAKKIRGYRVVYTAGYEDVPPDVALAVMDLVTYYRQNDAAVHSTKAPGTNSVQIEYISTTSLPAHIRRVLDLYAADYT
jgi:hypothetical protein